VQDSPDVLFILFAGWPFEHVPDERFEEFCMELETILARPATSRPCCEQKSVTDRCGFCLRTVGWHRYAVSSCAIDSWISVRWALGMLWRRGVEDVSVLVHSLLVGGRPPARILEMLDSMLETTKLSTSDHAYFGRLVVERTHKILDASPMHPVMGIEPRTPVAMRTRKINQKDKI